MKIVYKFVNGEKAVVDFNDFKKDEVSDEFKEKLYTVIFEMDEQWRKSDRREDDPERHDSLEVYNDKFKFAEDKYNPSVSEQVFKNFDKDKLYTAISKLKPAEQELLYYLFLKKNFITQAAYAKILGITENAVQLRLAKIKKKLKKIL